MKRFILKLVLVCVILVGVDRVSYFALQSVRPFDYRYFLESKQVFFDVDQKVDLLIIGDSHVADALNPKIIEEQTGMNTFNMGVYHSSPFENFHLLKACLDHLEQPPKYLIIGTNPVMFTRPLKPGKYTPLIINSMSKNYALYTEAGGLDFSYFFKTAQERHLFIAAKNRLLGKAYHPSRVFENTYNGYLQTTNHMGNTDFESTSAIKEASIIEEQVDYFAKSIELARQNGIQVILVHPPIWKNKMRTYETSSLYTSYQSTMQSTENEFGLPVFNKDRNLLENELVITDFLNPEHLNSFGAQKFSTHFSAWLNQLE